MTGRSITNYCHRQHRLGENLIYCQLKIKLDGEEKRKKGVCGWEGTRLRTPSPHTAPLLPRLHFTPSFLTLPPPNSHDGKWDVDWEVSSLSRGAPSSLRSSPTTCSTGLQQRPVLFLLWYPPAAERCPPLSALWLFVPAWISTDSRGNKLLHCGNLCCGVPSPSCPLPALPWDVPSPFPPLPGPVLPRLKPVSLSQHQQHWGALWLVLGPGPGWARLCPELGSPYLSSHRPCRQDTDILIQYTDLPNKGNIF